MCVCLSSSVSMYVEARGKCLLSPSIISYLISLRQRLSLTLELTDLGRLTMEPQVPPTVFTSRVLVLQVCAAPMCMSVCTCVLHVVCIYVNCLEGSTELNNSGPLQGRM